MEPPQIPQNIIFIPQNIHPHSPTSYLHVWRIFRKYPSAFTEKNLERGNVEIGQGKSFQIYGLWAFMKLCFKNGVLFLQKEECRNRKGTEVSTLTARDKTQNVINCKRLHRFIQPTRQIIHVAGFKH